MGPSSPDNLAPRESERQISPTLSSYVDYQLIEDTVFDFRPFPNCDSTSGSLLDIPLDRVIGKQEWTSCSFQDRSIAHLVMCEVTMTTIAASRFDDLFVDYQEKEQSTEENDSFGGSDGYLNESKMVDSRDENLRAASDASSSDNKSVLSDTTQPGREEHTTEFMSRLIDDQISIGDETSKSRSSIETLTPRARGGAFCFPDCRSSVPQKQNRQKVPEDVMKVYPIVCPSELATECLKCTQQKEQHNGSVGTTLRDLNIIFRQTEVTLEEIKDRLSWEPIIGNEKVVEVCDKPQNPFLHMRDEQNMRCAFCGLKTDSNRYVGFQFCFYYGKFGCNTCVTGKTNIIPAKIIFNWDFHQFAVSNLAKEFFEQTEFKPIYNPRVLCPRFLEESSKMAIMRRIEDLRLKISLVMECIDACDVPDAVRYKSKIRSHFHKTRTHLFEATGNYSLQDFVEISSTRVDNMEHYLKQILAQTKYHCERCSFCRQRYKLCLLCKDKELVFPWYNDSVVSCENCQRVFHKKCADRKASLICPSCNSSTIATKTSRRLTGIVSNSPNSVC